VVRFHEGAIPCPKKKVRIHERREKGTAGRGIEAPEASRLGFREAQPRHFEEFSARTAERIFARSVVLGCHRYP